MPTTNLEIVIASEKKRWVMDLRRPNQINISKRSGNIVNPPKRETYRTNWFWMYKRLLSNTSLNELERQRRIETGTIQ